MSSIVGPLIKERKEAKRHKMDINVGLFVTAKDGEMEDNTKEGGIRRMRKDIVGCVQDVVGKKNF